MSSLWQKLIWNFKLGISSTPAVLKASATFANGSTWTGDFSVTAHKSELTTETNAYENIHAWLDCADGWQKLPSGRVLWVWYVIAFWWDRNSKYIQSYCRWSALCNPQRTCGAGNQLAMKPEPTWWSSPLETTLKSSSTWCSSTPRLPPQALLLVPFPRHSMMATQSGFGTTLERRSRSAHMDVSSRRPLTRWTSLRKWADPSTLILSTHLQAPMSIWRTFLISISTCGQLLRAMQLISFAWRYFF